MVPRLAAGAGCADLGVVSSIPVNLPRCHALVVEIADNVYVISADVSVRIARAGDASAISRVQWLAWREVLSEPTWHSLDPDALAQTWTSAITSPPDSRSTVLVACEGDQVVGFAAYAPSRAGLPGDAPPDSSAWAGEVTALEVEPTHRRLGHGSRLLAACSDLARTSGAAELKAWSLENDQNRLTFLEAAGLTPMGIRRRIALPDAEVEEILLAGSLADAK